MTLSASRPDSHHVPCALIPYTLKIRSGCEGGGKGALIQEDKSATLACNNDQTVFVPVCIQGSMLNRKLENGPNGTGINEEGVCFTLNTIDRHAITAPAYAEDGEIIYLARKLTPTECASLQGFEKDWCSLVPHKDAPEYKMWGNGMAFPCMLYIMEGVQQVLSERYLDSLFGGESP